MFSSSCIKSCLKSFLIFVSSSSTQLLVNLRKNQKKLSHLLESQNKTSTSNDNKRRSSCRKYDKNNAIVYNKVYIVIYLLLSVISISNCAANALVDSSSTSDDLDIEELQEVFKKVAYQTSTTTTKRSIIDNVYVPSITTVPTPSLTTFRYVLSTTLFLPIMYNVYCVLFVFLVYRILYISYAFFGTAHFFVNILVLSSILKKICDYFLGLKCNCAGF